MSEGKIRRRVKEKEKEKGEEKCHPELLLR